MRTSMALFALGVLAAAAAAQNANPIGKGMLNPNAPIDISANSFSADDATKTAVYTGNVIVHQGEVALRANAMHAHFVRNSPDRITAHGNVVIVAPSGTATGDNGVYDVNPRVITLTGNVVLTKDKNVMRGQQLTVNLITGQAVLDGGQGQGGRVQALFTPKSETQNP
ncbi:MAG TPA: lipopolysaccharide transport periplasmic protein LptA [Rhizomicrobium sp.]|nr:lipopolysaccharide transport periplasmic protein LptA [Rhizomicrobium sp.]